MHNSLTIILFLRSNKIFEGNFVQANCQLVYLTVLNKCIVISLFLSLGAYCQ